MKKLKIRGEHEDQQQEKHKAYLSEGFKLKSTRKNKDGVVRRKYEN